MSVKEGNCESALNWFRKLEKSLGRLDEQFSGQRQQDASECFGLLLNQVKEFQGIFSEKDNLVDKLFGFVKVETSVCCNCGFTKKRTCKETSVYCQPSRGLSNQDVERLSSVFGSVTLQNLVLASFSDEHREVCCTWCGGRKAKESVKLARLPQVLHICLKRINFESSGGEKDNSVVNIPQLMNLSDLLKEDVKSSSGDNLYQLVSVVSHKGVGATSGHYVADVARLDNDGKWYHYDDQIVSPTTFKALRYPA